MKKFSLNLLAIVTLYSLLEKLILLSTIIDYLSKIPAIPTLYMYTAIIFSFT